MTREEAKELLPIIQAFAEGKTIEIYCDEDPGWHTMTITNPKFDLKPSHYRIKLETKYRPFKNIEECWNEMLKHQPFGWLKDKDDYWIVSRVFSYEGEEKITISNCHYSLSKAFENITFADGTPFGIKED